MLWLRAAVTGFTVHLGNLCSCFHPPASDAVSFFSFLPCSCGCARALRRRDQAAKRQGVAVFGGWPFCRTLMMERRRMDAALLVLFLGHLVTALEVPLDRKEANCTLTQYVQIQENAPELISVITATGWWNISQFYQLSQPLWWPIR